MQKSEERLSTVTKDKFKLRHIPTPPINWRQFLTLVETKAITKFFVVCMIQPDQKNSWHIYGISEQGLFQVMSQRREQRKWSSMDALIKTLRQEISEVPQPLRVYFDIDSALADLISLEESTDDGA